MHLLNKHFKILYAEDDESVRESYLLIFHEFFEHIDVAINGLDALQQYNQHFNEQGHYHDIVITDIVMPYMDGKELTQEIKTINSDQMIIITSAHNDTQNLIEFISMGVRDFFHKPLQLDHVIETFNKVIKELYAKEEKALLQAQLRDMLDNLSEGVLTFGSDLMIDATYSQECHRFFNTNIAHKHLPPLLFHDRYYQDLLIDAVNNICESDDPHQQQLFLSLLPKETFINEIHLSIEYKLLEDDRFMIVLNDITHQKSLQHKIDQERQHLKMVVAITSNRNDFLELISDFTFAGDQLLHLPSEYTDLQELLSDIYIRVHTFKGLFATYYFNHVVNGLHTLEQTLGELIKRSDSLEMIQHKLNQFDTHNWLNQDLQIASHYLGEAFSSEEMRVCITKSDLVEIQDALKRLQHKNIECQECKLIQTKIQSAQQIELYSFFEPYIKLLPDMAQGYDRVLKPMVIEGDHHLSVGENLTPFLKSLVHVFRNTVAHGIEDIDTRKAFKKDIEGLIGCRYRVEGENLIIEIFDDGAGLDLEKIKASILRANIFSSSQLDILHDEQIYKLIFHKHISTSETTTTLSGRGVGLSAVQEECEKLDGMIGIQTSLNQGTTFTFQVPITTIDIMNTIAHFCDYHFESDQAYQLTSYEMTKNISIFDYTVTIEFDKEGDTLLAFSFEQPLVEHFTSQFVYGVIEPEEQESIYIQTIIEYVNMYLGELVSSPEFHLQKYEFGVPKVMDQRTHLRDVLSILEVTTSHGNFKIIQLK
jgi:two-component system chemotaxis sensor kinase CheA